MEATHFEDLWSRLSAASRLELRQAAQADRLPVPSHEVIVDLKTSGHPEAVQSEAWTMPPASGSLEWVDPTLLQWVRETDAQ